MSDVGIAMLESDALRVTVTPRVGGTIAAIEHKALGLSILDGVIDLGQRQGFGHDRLAKIGGGERRPLKLIVPRQCHGNRVPGM